MLSFLGPMLSITNTKCVRGTSCLQEAHSLLGETALHSHVHAIVEGNMEEDVATIVLCGDSGECLLSYLGPVASGLCWACLHVWKLPDCWLGEDGLGGTTEAMCLCPPCLTPPQTSLGHLRGSSGGVRGSRSTLELFRLLLELVTNIPLAIGQVQNQNGRELLRSGNNGMDTRRPWETHGGLREV